MQHPDLTIDRDTDLQRNAAVLALTRQGSRTRCCASTLGSTADKDPERYRRAAAAGRPVYADAHHLSERGNRLLVPMFRQVYEHDHVAN